MQIMLTGGPHLRGTNGSPASIGPGAPPMMVTGSTTACWVATATSRHARPTVTASALTNPRKARARSSQGDLPTRPGADLRPLPQAATSSLPPPAVAIAHTTQPRRPTAPRSGSFGQRTLRSSTGRPRLTRQPRCSLPVAPLSGQLRVRHLLTSCPLCIPTSQRRSQP